MDKNKRNVLLSVIIAISLVAVLYIVIDYIRSQGREIRCKDGTRMTIDIRDFVNQYSSYSVELEAKINGQTTLKGKMEPVKLQELSETMQQTIQFRKFLVASYNSCAISQEEFRKYGIRFQNLDAIAREINTLAAKQSLSDAERGNLTKLVDQYITLSQDISEKVDEP